MIIGCIEEHIEFAALNIYIIQYILRLIYYHKYFYMTQRVKFTEIKKNMNITRLNKTSLIIKPSNPIISSIEKKFSKYNRNYTVLQQRLILYPLIKNTLKQKFANWTQKYPKTYR